MRKFGRFIRCHDSYVALCLQYNLEEQEAGDAENMDFGHKDCSIQSIEFESRFFVQETDELILFQRIKRANEF